MPEITIRVVDLETSGKVAKEGAEVVEFAFTDLRVDSETREFSVGETFSELFGVAKPMDAEVMAVHHIRNDQIAGLPLCAPERLGELISQGSPWYLATHQADFERQWITDDLIGEAKWLDTYKAARQMRREGPYSNQALKYALGFGDLPHDRCMPPHRAGPDTYVTAHILGQQLQTTTGKQIEAWTRSPVKYWTCPIGKHKGQAWEMIPFDYLQWMVRQADMEDDLKHAATAEMAARRDRQTSHLSGAPS